MNKSWKFSQMYLGIWYYKATISLEDKGEGAKVSNFSSNLHHTDSKLFLSWAMCDLILVINPGKSMK